MLSGGGSTLLNLCRAIRDPERAAPLSGVEIAHVISSRADARGIGIARDADLPVSVVPRREFNDGAAFSAAITAVLEPLDVDLVVLAGFLSLWRIPARFRWRVLNIHPALLPKFGGRGMFGLHVHRAVLAAGERESGCTVHLADDEYDHGPIVAQERVPVLADDTPESLAARVQEAERVLYPRVLQQVADHGVGWLDQFHF